jgi:hypothetical protein
MDRIGEGPVDVARFVVAGYVPAGSDELRITFVDGEEGVFPVEGEVFSAPPDFRGPPDFRAFVLPLGNSMYRRIDFLEQGRVVEHVELTPREVERMECFARFPHPAGTITPEGELARCLRDADGV